MRLRRETGDFRIKVTDNDGTITANTIRTGLGVEDLIGEVVDAAGVLEVINKALDAGEVINATCTSYTLVYTKATGEISVSGSSQETGDFQINGTLVEGEGITWSSIRPGLTAEDLNGAVIRIDGSEDNEFGYGYPAYATIVGAQPLTDGVINLTPAENIVSVLQYNTVTGEITEQGMH